MRRDLADLADDDVLDAPVPAFVAPTPRSLRLSQIAPNPYNTRDIDADAAQIAELAKSIELHGQLQASTVVTLEAFLAIFPEHATSLAEQFPDATHVQVMGGRRRAAALLLDQPTLDVSVKDELAASRTLFLEATAAENIDRQELDPIAEARAIDLIAKEHNSRKAAAERLSKTPAWVTQRLNLLLLDEKVQGALRSRSIPLNAVRDWHNKPPGEQLALLSARQESGTQTGTVAAVKATARKSAPPVIDPSVVKIRLWGSPQVCEQALEAIRQALKVTSITDWRADRGSPDIGRIYLEAELSGGGVVE